MSKEKLIPNIGDYVRQEGRLRQVTVYQAPPPPPVTYYIFEDMEARIELRRKGKTIDSYGTTNEFYGEGTSVTNAIKDAKSYCKNQEVDASSEVEFVVIKVVELKARVVTHQENFYNKGLVDFTYDNNLPLAVRELLGKSQEEIVWSSKKDSLEVEE